VRLTEDYLIDPYPIWRAMRAESPVTAVTTPGG
jgi:hypothetical protein